MVAQCPYVVEVEACMPGKGPVMRLIVQIPHVDIHNLLPSKMLFDRIHVVDHLLCSKFNVPVVMHAVSWTLSYKGFKLTRASCPGRVHCPNVAEPCAAYVESRLPAVFLRHHRLNGIRLVAT
eukprot:6474165-Amphidinium_carterae.3